MAKREERLDGSGHGNGKKTKVPCVVVTSWPLSGFVMTSGAPNPGELGGALEINERSGESINIEASGIKTVELNGEEATRLRQVLGGARGLLGLSARRFEDLPEPEFEPAAFKVGKVVGTLVFGTYTLGDEVAIIRSCEYLADDGWDRAHAKLVERAQSGSLALQHGAFQQYHQAITSQADVDRIFTAVAVDLPTVKVLKKLLSSPGSMVNKHESFNINQTLSSAGAL